MDISTVSQDDQAMNGVNRSTPYILSRKIGQVRQCDPPLALESSLEGMVMIVCSTFSTCTDFRKNLAAGMIL